MKRYWCCHRHDFIRRLVGHRVQPYGSDSVEGLHARFFVFRFGQDLRESRTNFPSGGSITIIAVTTLSGGDITHAVPDNTGYITEGQLFLRRDSDIGKVIVDPFRSLSRLKQLVAGKKTRKDHPQVMNAAVRLYADAANAKTKMENGFDLTDYDNRTLSFAKDYADKLLAIDVNLNTTEMLDVTWGLFAKYFKPEEVNIKKELVDEFWTK